MSRQLGLYLKMGIKHICLLFGVTPSSCSRVIMKIMHKLVRVLKWNNFAAVRFPAEEKASAFAELISLREPKAKNSIGFMDGLSLHTKCTSEQRTQNTFYNGYHGDTMVNNVLVYGPDGKVFFCCLNYPGSWHDAAIVQETRSGISRFAQTRAFRALVQPSTPWWVLTARERLKGYRRSCESINWLWLRCTLLCGKPPSWECAHCRPLSRD